MSDMDNEVDQIINETRVRHIITETFEDYEVLLAAISDQVFYAVRYAAMPLHVEKCTSHTPECEKRYESLLFDRYKNYMAKYMTGQEL